MKIVGSQQSAVSSLRLVVLLPAICYLLITITLYCLLATCFIHSAPPFPFGLGQGKCISSVRKIPDVRILRAQGFTEEAIEKALGTTGTKTIAIILVNFTSAGGTTSGSPTITSYGSIQTNISSFVNYYNEVSCGKLKINVVYFPSNSTAYNLGNSMETYGAGDLEPNGKALLEDAITKANINTSTISAVMVIHAGYGQEVSGSGDGDIYSHYRDDISKNGFTDGMIVPEKELSGINPLGVICHEFGHQLGFADLYNTNDSSTQVGNWCLMDGGTYLGNPYGSNPAHPSAWCKQYISWVTPVLINKKATERSIYPSEIYDNSGTNKSVFKILVKNSTQEYYLVEYRKKTAGSFDRSIPGEGLLIWHIDDSIGTVVANDINNTPNPYAHRRVDLEEADGTDKSSEASDTFPGTLNATEWGPDTSPSSKKYDGKDSEIEIVEISDSGGEYMTAVFLTGGEETKFVKAVNSPNPFKPQDDGSTTIIFEADSELPNRTLDIYTISGDLVNSFGEEKITKTREDLTTGRTVYKCIWDGKNSDGDMVASGIYVYLLRSKVKGVSSKKTGKLAIIR